MERKDSIIYLFKLDILYKKEKMDDFVYRKWLKKINGMCNDANLEDERIMDEGKWDDKKVQYFKLNEGIHVYKVWHAPFGCLDNIFIYPQKKEMEEVQRDYHNIYGHDKRVSLSISCEDEFGHGCQMNGLDKNGKRIHRFQ